MSVSSYLVGIMYVIMMYVHMCICILEGIQQQLADNGGFGLLVQVMATSKVTFSLSSLHINKSITMYPCQQTIICCTHLKITCNARIV